MNSPMKYTFWSLIKGLATYITFMWFLCSMNSPMHCKFCSLIKALSHISHLYGFPPVWILWCLVSFESWRKVMSHSLHLSGLFFCVSWSSSSSEGCITAFSCLWEKPLQTLRVLWDDKPEALKFVTTWLHSKIIRSDCTLCNSSWKVDPCLSKGLFPASLLLWWSLPSVRFCYGM